MDSATATKMVTRRFLAAFGPATVHDLARWWGGGGVATARQWIAALGEEVAAVAINGTQAWMLAQDIQEISKISPPRSVRLLPAFDQYVIGASRNAEQLMTGGARGLVYRPQGWISPVLLADGFMQGVWRHETKGNQVEVRITPFTKLPKWVRIGAEEEAERLAKFLDRRLTLVWQN